MCAGPGGKAALLGAIAKERGARLQANEPQEARARLVRDALAPLGDVADVTTWDALEAGAFEPGTFDRVLVDAPCTGLGALRRRPEARWRHQPSDLGQLGPLQRGLLASAFAAVRPGGIVAYSTCSPHLAETALVVRDLLRAHPEFEVVDAGEVPVLAATGAVGQGYSVEEGGTRGLFQLWTDTHGTDSMFLALLRRKA
jgi:16S rRNA (cytosine967-C5)-methyltransferase